MSEKMVERFSEGVRIAREAGMDVRFANLSGAGGGWCQVAERSFVFVDLSLDVLEQLDSLENALATALEESRGLRSSASAETLVRHWLGRPADSPST